MGQLNFHQRLATIASRAGLHEPIHHAPKINNNNWNKKKKKRRRSRKVAQMFVLYLPPSQHRPQTQHIETREDNTSNFRREMGNGK